MFNSREFQSFIANLSHTYPCQPLKGGTPSSAGTCLRSKVPNPGT